MIVIKLGGSLLAANFLPACLDKIGRSYGAKQVVIVPGGGLFAEQVRSAQRQWRFDDHAAHHMAILAMQQMALVLKAFRPDFALAKTTAQLSGQGRAGGVAVWSPDGDELDRAGIQPGWDITSDSLSAWLAKTLQSEELVLVKSVKIAPDTTTLNLVRQQVVDTAFHKFIEKTSFKLSIVYAKDFVSQP